MHKLICRFVTTTKKKKKIPDRNLDTASPAGIPCKKQDACYTGITRDAGADSFIPTVCFAD